MGSSRRAQQVLGCTLALAGIIMGTLVPAAGGTPYKCGYLGHQVGLTSRGSCPMTRHVRIGGAMVALPKCGQEGSLKGDDGPPWAVALTVDHKMYVIPFEGIIHRPGCVCI